MAGSRAKQVNLAPELGSASNDNENRLPPELVALVEALARVQEERDYAALVGGEVGQ